MAIQYGNAFGQGLQAAALKPADFFGNDDVLYLMEDMATGEIRLSILWEWLHKGAVLTDDDQETGAKARAENGWPTGRWCISSALCGKKSEPIISSEDTSRRSRTHRRTLMI